MRSYPFLLSAFVIIGATCLQCRPANQSEQANGTEKIWTNADLDQLREKGLISLVGPDSQEVPFPPAPVGSQAAPLAPPSETVSEPLPYDKTKDPAWYAGEAERIRTEFELTEAGLRASDERLTNARDTRETQPGINLDRGNVGVTPQEGVAVLEQRAREVQDELDQLDDLARRNDIPPGVLRN